MYTFEYFEGRFYRQAVVGQQGPVGLFISLNRGIFFGKRPFETNNRVHVAVGQMVHYLADGPTTGAVLGVQLFFGKAHYSMA